MLLYKKRCLSSYLQREVLRMLIENDILFQTIDETKHLNYNEFFSSKRFV